MDLLNPQTLLVGGAFAAIAAGWSQVKQVLHYLSSFGIVTATIDGPGTADIVSLILTEYRRLPGGRLTYYLERLLIKSGGVEVIPFQGVTFPFLAFKGLSVVLVSVNPGGDVSITFLRGTVKIENLIRRGLDHFKEWENSANTTNSRFAIYKVLGEEKGAWASAAAWNRKTGSGSETPAVSQGTVTPSNQWLVRDSRRDRSLTLPKSEYVFNLEVDPFQALFYDEEVHRHVDQAVRWANSRKWYTDRMLPHKRGLLLHGPGSTGKSSLARAIAQKLNMPLYHYYLTTLSDRELVERWGDMMTPCVVLFEDFDTVFDMREPLTEHKSLTFDCVLNTLSGVSSVDGVYLIITTNHIEKIDPALGVMSEHGSISTRPGRIDQVLYLGTMSEASRRKMAENILRDWPEVIDELVKDNDNMTPAQFQEACTQYAFERMRHDEEKAGFVNCANPPAWARTLEHE